MERERQREDTAIEIITHLIELLSTLRYAPSTYFSRWKNETPFPKKRIIHFDRTFSRLKSKIIPYKIVSIFRLFICLLDNDRRRVFYRIE